MPFKDRKTYLKYHKRYNDNKAKQKADLHAAIKAGNITEAKRILKRKLTVSMVTTPA